MFPSPRSERKEILGSVHSGNLYELAEHREFGTQRDEHIRDRIVIGILHKSLSQKLWVKSDHSLEIAIQMTRQSELVKLQVSGQSDDKHLGEVIKGKESQLQRGKQSVIGVTGTPKTIR